VDSHLLSKDWPHPVLIVDPNVYLARPQTDGNFPRAIEIWNISNSGKYTKLGERGVAANASVLSSTGGLLAAQEDTGIEVFDLGKPIELPPVGQGSPGGCVGWDLDQAFGSIQDGFWLPLGFYGTAEIELKQ
jgi:hypothetical protein